MSDPGAGGFAVVYLVRDLSLRRKLAIKVLSPDLIISKPVPTAAFSACGKGRSGGAADGGAGASLSRQAGRVI